MSTVKEEDQYDYEKILRPKYRVQRIVELNPPQGTIQDVGLPVLSTNPDDIDSPFVLMPRKDPAAFMAMITYMNSCEPRLANEISTWLKKIAAAPAKVGTQGQRNTSSQLMMLVENSRRG